MKKILPIISAALLTGILLNSCKKEFDHPPLKTVNEGAKVMIFALKQRVPADGSFYKFGTSDTSLYGTVIADESSGNIYKTSYIVDEAGHGIQLNLLNAGGLAVGDNIRINLNNLYVANRNNMIYLDSVDLGKSVVKLSSGNTPTPKVVTISQINAGATPSSSNSLQGQLVQILDVEFVEKNQTYADGITKQDMNRTLRTCGVSNTLIVRSSGYANFANSKTPQGSGSVIGIVTQYNSDMQLTLRNVGEVEMSGPGCPVPTFTLGTPVSSVNENFNTVTTGQTYSNTGWINVAENGSAKWKTDVTTSGTITAKTLKATAYGSGEPANTMWIITPPIIYTNTMTLSFKTAFGFWDNGHPNAIKAYVSTDFNGSNLTTANWTAVTANYTNGTGSFYPNAFTNSGTITLNTIGILSGYSGNFFVGWKYSGTEPTYNSNIYLDDIIVQ